VIPRDQSTLREQLSAQVDLACTVPFWAARLKAARTSETSFADLVVLRKEELRRLAPWELVPPAERGRVRHAFSTSGTTGASTTCLWTADDWRAQTATVSAELAKQCPDARSPALSTYDPRHLAANLYRDALEVIGLPCFFIHHQHQTAADIVRRAADLECDAMVIAERRTAKVGCSIDDLLAHDPLFFRNRGIRWWIGSTATFSRAARSVAEEQGVAAVTNFYGSSEFGFLAVSCVREPMKFHTLTGHVLVEVLGANGAPAPSGERGELVVTALGSLTSAGVWAPHAGSQLLRFANGDEATVLREPCICGSSAPALVDIRRTA
jgi:hypothetical protein